MRCKACNAPFYPNPYTDRLGNIQFEEVCDYCQQLGTSGLSSEDISDLFGLDKEYKRFINVINSEKGNKDE